ncbi:MAG: SprB repeat-containing protein, partial [Bacteroidota bacterium]
MSLNLRNLTIICLFILFSGNILAQGSLSIASITTEDVSCLNGNDGSITITIQGGQPPYTYTWIRLPFAFDQIISNETTVTFPGNFPITATSYLIDISDSLGNNVSGNAIVNQPSSAVAVSIAPDPAQTCSGNDLQLSGNASGGTPPYTHLWSGAGAAFLNDPTIENPIFNSTEGGDYELSYTLTDDNGCFTSQTITVSNTDNPQTNAGSDDQQCGNSYELNATQSFGTGTWTASGPGSASFSNINDPNAEVTVDLPGTYTFTWTEVNNGCSDA